MAKLLGTRVVERMEERWSTIVKKVKNHRDILMKDLATMQEAYGSDVVQELAKRDLNGMSIHATPQSPIPSPQKSRGKTRGKGGVAPSRSKRHQDGQFTALKPHVVTAIQSLAESEFTTKDIAKALEDAGVKNFKSSHLTLIMARNITGVKKVGTRMREGKGGSPLNVYRIDPAGSGVRLKDSGASATVRVQ